ncbi:hydroxymethylbilane synthase [Cytophagaceae bacterium ABcell3]|nr:hydroxymethylbilane synthase [Cytophagaceae bacterium ABcell3]
MKELIRIGSRASKLALWQTYYIEDRLKQAGFATEIFSLESKGDKVLHTSFAEIGTKGLFTEELEDKLISGEIDIAVHSAKDMQTDLGKDLELIAFTEREGCHDVLLSLDKNFNIDDSSENWLIGTSSTRRNALLKYYYPHTKTTEARGNLQTRMKKLEDGKFQAMILAYAGVHRMGMESYIVKNFATDEFTPAVGQGCIAVEASKNLDPQKRAAIRNAVNHQTTEICLLAERAFLKKLEGGCSIPVFGLATINNDQLSISGGVISLDGKEMIKTSMTGSTEHPEQLGLKLAEDILSKGGGKVLEEIKRVRS